MKGIRVQLICVGKMKEKFYIDAAAEYVKRLSAYCKLQVVELPEESLVALMVNGACNHHGKLE